MKIYLAIRRSKEDTDQIIFHFHSNKAISFFFLSIMKYKVLLNYEVNDNSKVYFTKECEHITPQKQYSVISFLQHQEVKPEQLFFLLPIVYSLLWDPTLEITITTIWGAIFSLVMTLPQAISLQHRFESAFIKHEWGKFRYPWYPPECSYCRSILLCSYNIQLNSWDQNLAICKSFVFWIFWLI